MKPKVLRIARRRIMKTILILLDRKEKTCFMQIRLEVEDSLVSQGTRNNGKNAMNY